MANILSQEEVDALLNAVDDGVLDAPVEDETDSEDAQTVVEYNFRRPSLLTKEQLRGFNNLHENFARDVQGMLSLRLRTNIEFKLVSTDQQLYNEFVLSLSNITHLILFPVEPLPGMAVLEINLSLVFGIVDLLLGGKGDVETETRKLTEVEIAIIEPLVENIIRQLEVSWNYVLPVKIKQDHYESNPEYVLAAPSDAPVVVLTFDAKVGLANGIINLCYPLPMVQSLLLKMQRSSGQFDNYYGKADNHDAQKHVLSALMDVPLFTSTSLGNANILARDLISLSPGDIIVLDNKINSPLCLNVGDRPFFQGRPGKVNRNVAVKINKRIDSGHETNEVEQLLTNPN